MQCMDYRTVNETLVFSVLGNTGCHGACLCMWCVRAYVISHHRFKRDVDMNRSLLGSNMIILELKSVVRHVSVCVCVCVCASQLSDVVSNRGPCWRRSTERACRIIAATVTGRAVSVSVLSVGSVCTCTSVRKGAVCVAVVCVCVWENMSSRETESRACMGACVC